MNPWYCKKSPSAYEHHLNLIVSILKIGFLKLVSPLSKGLDSIRLLILVKNINEKLLSSEFMESFVSSVLQVSR